MSTAHKTRLYGTLSRIDSRNAWTAILPTTPIRYSPLGIRPEAVVLRVTPSATHSVDKELFERLLTRRE